jgi:hypothetical protein
LRPRLTSVAGLAAAAVALLVPTAAHAATIQPTQSCYRYGSNLAGERWVGVTGSGFTAGTDPTVDGVRLDYTGGVMAGQAPLAPDGSFIAGFLMPDDFVRRGSGLVKRYTIMATDLTNPAITATTEVTFVRAGIYTKPRRVPRDLHRAVRWALYGAPTGARMHAHWTLDGRRYARRNVGRARGSCGIVRRRMPFLPVAVRRGTWKIYFTRGKRLKRRNVVFRADLKII